MVRELWRSVLCSNSERSSLRCSLSMNRVTTIAVDLVPVTRLKPTLYLKERNF